MVRIGILTCSNATQDLCCSSVSCLRDIRNRSGAFERYKSDKELDLIGIINCSGCPTSIGSEKLLKRIRALAEFSIDAIHFAYCIDLLCPFKEKYKELIKNKYPTIEIIMGSHQSHVSHDQFRNEVRELLCQESLSMVDVIKSRQST